MNEAAMELLATRARRFKPYPKYKDSGVEWLGKIPSHWRSTRLRYITRLNPVKSEVRGLNSQLPVSFVPMEAVGEYGDLALDTVKPLAACLEGYTYFRDGDVVVAKITPCFENGKGALATGLENGIGFGTTELHVLRSAPGVDTRFVFYLTLSDHFRRLGAATMYGAGGQKRVPEDFIRNLRHPLPSEPEQRAIAAFLDRETARIDALVAKKERVIELLQEKRTALVSRTVTKGLDPSVRMKDSGVEWLGEIPRHWNACALRHVIRGGTRNGLYKNPEYYQLDGTPMVQMGEAFASPVVASCASDRLKLTTAEKSIWALDEGDLLFARRSLVFEGSGKCSIVGQLPEPHVFESSLIRVRPDKMQVVPNFLFLFLQSSVSRAQILAMTKKVTISGIDSQQLKAVCVLVPPKPEQIAIVDFIRVKDAEFQKLIDKVHQALDRLREFRSALIAAAVTGKIDVREEVA